MKKFIKVLLIILAVIVALGGAGFGYIYSKLNKIYVKEM